MGNAIASMDWRIVSQWMRRSDLPVLEEASSAATAVPPATPTLLRRSRPPPPLDAPPLPLAPHLSPETLRLLKSFDVDPIRGFLPARDPLQRLPQPELQEWERIAGSLPALLAQGTLREAIDALPELPTNDLATTEELHRALLLLSFMCSAYVWGEGGDKPADALPAALARPLCAVARRVGVPPMISHLSVVLANWRRLDPEGPIAAGNLAALVQFLGDPDEAAFYYVTAEIEARGGPAMASLLEARHAAADATAAICAGAASHKTIADAASAAASCLCHAAACIRAMREALLRLPDRCDPSVFYNRVRPFLSGCRGNPTLPDGVLYLGCEEEGEDEGGSEVGRLDVSGCRRGSRRRYYGGSAAQSSLAAAFDAALGVEHKGHQGAAGASSREFLLNMREYMPPGHRRFLAYLEDPCHANIRAFASALSGASGPEAAALRLAYNDCLAALEDFRTGHLAIVARYVMLQQRRLAQLQAQTATDSAAYALDRAAGGKGTGGTGLMEFLRPMRDDVGKAALPGLH